MSRMLSLLSVLGCFKTAVVVIPLLLLQVKLSRTSSCGIQLDMVVAVDTSSSCTEAEFQQLVTEVKGIVSGLPVGQEKNRLALIGMSQSAKRLANFNDVNSLTDFNSAVDRLRLTAGQTDISTGMKLARESALNTARRAPTSRILLLVKDRRCNDDSRVDADSSELSSIASEAAALRLLNCSIHAVATGGLWNSNVLNSLFGSDYLLFKNRNKAMESIKSLNNLVCPPACKNSGHNVREGTCFSHAKHLLSVNVTGFVNSAGVRTCRQEIVRYFQWCPLNQSCSSIERTIGSCEPDGNVAIAEKWQFFEKATQSCVIHEEKHKVSCGKEAECKSQVADVIIILDRSMSLFEKYHTLVDAAMELVRSLHIGANNVHISVVSFTQGPLRVAVNLGEEFDKTKILEKVKALKKEYYFSQTFTGEALNDVKEMFNHRGRPGVTKAIILLTDGQSTDPEKTFRAASELKQAGVTIYAIGVKPTIDYGVLNMEELNMLTSPESDKNLFILEKFEELQSWAVKFSNRLCIELAPPNPKLCDAGVQYKSISGCVASSTTRETTMQTTLISYKYDAKRKCIKSFRNSVIVHCKDVCIDPIDGSGYLEGETWTNLCHEFRCNRGRKTLWPRKTARCVAADYSCKSIGSAPFQCRNIDGEIIDNCQCVDRNGDAVLVINNPN